jgi:cytochrome c
MYASPPSRPASVMRRAVWLCAFVGAIAAQPARADGDLARQRNCLGCHTLEDKRIGPSFKQVATRYASDRDAAARLALKIRQGGAGVWGPVPMPANAQVSEAEASRLVGWILGLK